MGARARTLVIVAALLLPLLLLARTELASAQTLQQAAEFNETLALSAAEASSFAYCAPSAIASWRVGATCPTLASFEFVAAYAAPSNGASYYVAVSHARRQYVLAFGGYKPTSWSEWALELESAWFDTTPVSFVGNSTVALQSSFWSRYAALQASLLEQLPGAFDANPGYSLVVTGHATGGSAATLALVNMLALQSAAVLSNITLLTFAEPRTGDNRLSSLLASLANARAQRGVSAYRVTHNDDALVHLPPCHRAFLQNVCSRANSYPHHHTQEVWYSQETMRGASHRVCSIEDGEDTSCSLSRQFFSLSEHDAYNYYGLDMPSACCPSSSDHDELDEKFAEHAGRRSGARVML